MSNGPTITIVGDFDDLPTVSYQSLARLLLAMSEPSTPPPPRPSHTEDKAAAESMLGHP